MPSLRTPVITSPLRLTGQEVDVWLVPELEIPLRHLIDSVPAHEVLCKGRDEVSPSCPVFGRRNDWLVPERVQNLLGRKLSWHEAQFNERADPVLQKTVVDVVDI